MKTSNPLAKAHEIAQSFRDGRRPSARVRAEATEETGQLYLYSAIGQNWFGDGITASSVKDQLAKMKGVKNLAVYVNSEGGDVWEAKAIYEQLRRFDAKKTVHIDGLAASAATLICMAADEIRMAKHATFMIHDAWGVGIGNASDLRETANILEMESKAIAGIYADRTHLTLPECTKMMADETWMNAEEAKEHGFVDAIDGPETEEEKTAPAALVARNRERLSALAMKVDNLKPRASPVTPGQPGKK